jgi:alcohol dehydrogenase
VIRRKSSNPPPPRGWIRHYGASLTDPGAAATASKVVLERDADLRASRLLASARDGVRERLRPSRAKMRALVATPGGRLAWRSVPAPPPPAPRGATVRPLAIATCDIDCGLAAGATPLLLPLQLGHECVAEVLRVGSEVSSVKVGDRVIVPFQINCGECEPCRAGMTGNCASVPAISMYGMGVLAGHWGGAFADELAVPYADAMLVRLPDGVDPIAATSLADNICDAHRHVVPHLGGALARDPDAEVLILGACTPRFAFGSSAPLYVGMIAQAEGARRVTLADNRPAVRAAAERLGLQARDPRELRGSPPAPLVVDSSFHPRGLALALSRTAPDGVCSCAGSLHARGSIPLLSMYTHNVTLHLGRAHVRSILPDALELVASGRLRSREVVDTVAPLDEAPQVLRDAFRRGGPKVVLTAA